RSCAVEVIVGVVNHERFDEIEERLKIWGGAARQPIAYQMTQGRKYSVRRKASIVVRVHPPFVCPSCREIWAEPNEFAHKSFWGSDIFAFHLLSVTRNVSLHKVQGYVSADYSSYEPCQGRSQGDIKLCSAK